jgi:hypothetical protein
MYTNRRLKCAEEECFLLFISLFSQRSDTKNTCILNSDCYILLAKCSTLRSVFFGLVPRILLTPDFILVDVEHLKNRLYYYKHVWSGLRHACTEAGWFPTFMLYIDVWEAPIWRFMKRYETFMNVNRYVVKHVSEVQHSSASMDSFRAFGHDSALPVQKERYRQTDRKTLPSHRTFSF